MARRTLLMDLVHQSWFYDAYTPDVVMHYGEEGAGVHSLLVGGDNGFILQYTGNSDAVGASQGYPIPCIVQTPSLDQGDPRDNKLYGDVMLDADTQTVPVTVTPGFANYSSLVAAVVVTTSSRTQTPVPLDAAWQTFKNIAIQFTFSINSSNRPLFYIWEPRWTFESAPLSAFSWEISPTTFGMENFKHAGMVKITHVSSSDIQLVFTIDNVVQPTITIPNSGGSNYVQNIFRVPVMKGKIWKVRLASASEFRLDTRDSFFEIKDWGKDMEYQKLRILSDFSLVEG